MDLAALKDQIVNVDCHTQSATIDFLPDTEYFSRLTQQIPCQLTSWHDT
jgi:hypothetical protein